MCVRSPLSHVFEQVEQMKMVIAGLQRDIQHESEQRAVFQARAMESCELSEMWAEKYRQNHDKRKLVHHRIRHSALVAIKLRLDRRIKLHHLLDWRSLAGRKE